MWTDSTIYYLLNVKSYTIFMVAIWFCIFFFVNLSIVIAMIWAPFITMIMMDILQVMVLDHEFIGGPSLLFSFFATKCNWRWSLIIEKEADNQTPRKRGASCDGQWKYKWWWGIV